MHCHGKLIQKESEELAVMYPYAGFSLHKDTTPPQPNHTVTQTHIEPEQYNT